MRAYNALLKCDIQLLSLVYSKLLSCVAATRHWIATENNTQKGSFVPAN